MLGLTPWKQKLFKIFFIKMLRIKSSTNAVNFIKIEDHLCTVAVDFRWNYTFISQYKKKNLSGGYILRNFWHGVSDGYVQNVFSYIICKRERICYAELVMNKYLINHMHNKRINIWIYFLSMINPHQRY
jgi:hypothetical protein